MTKKELIDCIRAINISAGYEFLSQFSAEELNAYLNRLLE